MADLPFPFFEFRGTHREIGRQHGEALRERIAGHLEIVYERAARRSGLSPAETLELALAFEPFIRTWAPGFMEEIEGLAEGAGLSRGEALLLQVRQEAVHTAWLGSAAGGGSPSLGSDDLDDECTTFAVTGPYTIGGRTYAGQNADLPGGIERVAAVVQFTVPGKPAVLMLIPAGQISYIGMNSEGLCAFANFLSCTGWRPGFPRYLLTRLALEQPTLQEAESAVLQPPRASSRNLLLADRHGGMVDIETTVDAHGRMEGNGWLVHANHYVHPELEAFDVSNPRYLANSRARHGRLAELIGSRAGSIDLECLKTFLRDHGVPGDSICVHPSPSGDDRRSYTFASVIAEVDQRTLHIAQGPPCRHEYAGYGFA